MIYQLLKRDDVWRMVPYCVLVSLVAYPLMGTPVARSAWLGGMLGLWSLVAAMSGLQRATRFQAGLPIAARQLFLTRLLSLLGILWLPALAGSGMMLVVTGTAHAASALAVAKAAALYTLVIAAMQSIRVRELGLPSSLVMPAVILTIAPVSMLVATHVGAIPVLAVCLPLSALLLLWTWRTFPRSYQLAPAGRHARTATVPNVEKRAKTTVRFSPAAAWWPVLHSVYPGHSFLVLPIFAIGALSGQWVLGGWMVAGLWFTARQQSRWLWSLPINTRALLPTILTPVLLILAAAYFTGVYLPRRHPIPVPDSSVQILTLALMLGCALLAVLCMVLYDWRRLGRFPKWVRALPALLVGIPVLVPGVIFLFAPSAIMDQFAHLQRDIPQVISHAIPGGVLGAVAVSVAALAALYWAVERVFSEPEFAGKARPPQDLEFLRR